MGGGGCGGAGVVSGLPAPVDGKGDRSLVRGSIGPWVVVGPVVGAVVDGKPTGGCASAGRAINISAVSASVTCRACTMGAFLLVISAGMGSRPQSAEEFGPGHGPRLSVAGGASIENIFITCSPSPSATSSRM